jgi:hypothetical protein
MNTKQEYFNNATSTELSALTALYSYKEKVTGLKHTITMEQDQHSPYDAIVCRDIGCVVVELKIRNNYSYTQIKKYGGSFLEETKLRLVLEKQINESLDLPVHYVVIYSDVAVIYSLNKDLSTYNWVNESLPNNGYNKELVIKKVCMLSDNYILEIIPRNQ